jgi:DnaK suppressor protein
LRHDEPPVFDDAMNISIVHGRTIMTDQQNGLGEDFIAKQRERLLAMQRDLLGGEENTIADERTIQSERGSEANEMEDDAQNLEQDIANQALRNVNDKRIGDIQRALEKIADGTYGYSDESGDPIPKARLEAMPEAIYTVAEQEKRETKP